MNIIQVDIQVDHEGHNYRLDSFINGLLVVDVDYGQMYIRHAVDSGYISINMCDKPYFDAIPQQHILQAISNIIHMLVAQRGEADGFFRVSITSNDAV